MIYRLNFCNYNGDTYCKFFYSYNDVVTYFAWLLLLNNFNMQDFSIFEVKNTEGRSIEDEMKAVLVITYNKEYDSYGMNGDTKLQDGNQYTPEQWDNLKGIYEPEAPEFIYQNYKTNRKVFSFVNKNTISELKTTIEYSKSKNKKQEVDFSKLSLDEDLFTRK